MPDHVQPAPMARRTDAKEGGREGCTGRSDACGRALEPCACSRARHPLWSPTIRCAVTAGTPWLDVYCPGCRTSHAIDIGPSTAIRSHRSGAWYSACGVLCVPARRRCWCEWDRVRAWGKHRPATGKAPPIRCCAPTPGTGKAVEGSALMRQCVLAAVGCLNSAASVWRRQRRSSRPITPEPSAASCKRREAVIERRAPSATTAPSLGWRRASSKQARTAFSSPAST